MYIINVRNNQWEADVDVVGYLAIHRIYVEIRMAKLLMEVAVKMLIHQPNRVGLDMRKIEYMIVRVILMLKIINKYLMDNFLISKF